MGQGAIAELDFGCERVAGGPEGTLLALRGELDLSHRSQFQDALAQAGAGTEVLVLDVRELQLIDCSALRVIFDAAADEERGGCRVLVLRGPGAVSRVLESIGASRWVQVVDSASAEPPVRALFSSGHLAAPA